MPRAKGGPVTRKRRKKILKLAKGHRAGRHRLFRQANESVMHALQYAYEHRRDRKGQFRRLWIGRINAAARLNGVSYSRLMNGLSRAGVQIDRKVLADLAVRDAPAFARLAATAKGALAG
ncbi:MAG TPA: 50S ribosomal protein L20 [Dehalococcoidia bacterium]|nr:50S ribosomal protein L20 [Dehalococcoidia bacterium]